MKQDPCPQKLGVEDTNRVAMVTECGGRLNRERIGKIQILVQLPEQRRPRECDPRPFETGDQNALDRAVGLVQRRETFPIASEIAERVRALPLRGRAEQRHAATSVAIEFAPFENSRNVLAEVQGTAGILFSHSREMLQEDADAPGGAESFITGYGTRAHRPPGRLFLFLRLLERWRECSGCGIDDPGEKRDLTHAGGAVGTREDVLGSGSVRRNGASLELLVGQMSHRATRIRS